jgi:hypothetical protein
MVIRGETKLVKVYDITSFVDASEYSVNEISDIEKFNDSVISFLQEAEAFELPEELIGIVPDSAEIEINEESVSFEDVEYVNKSVDELITANFSDGDVVVLFQAIGEGYFEYEENPSLQELKIGYTACDLDLVEDIYDFFCDLLLPKSVYVNDERIEPVATNFYPKDTMVAEVYTIKDGSLVKISEIDVMHFGWDLFEDIIQVEYE